MSDNAHNESDARLGAAVRRWSENLYVIWVALAAITMVRNSLEMLGILTRSPNYCCFSPDRSSFLNTFTYELLLIFGGIYIVHLVIGGARAQLRRIIALSTAFMAPLFIFVPLVNLALNYQGPRIPIYLAANIYLPMGSVLGFSAIAILLPLLIRRVYPDAPLVRVLLGLGAGFATMFLWTYVFGFRLSFSTSAWLWEREANLMDIYSLSFVAPLVITYPLFVRSFRPAGQRGHAWASYLLVLAVSGWLLHTSRAVADPTRVREPIVCQQAVVPRSLANMAPDQVRRHLEKLASAAKDARAFALLRAAATRLSPLPLPSRLVYRRIPGPGSGPLHRAAFALKPGQVSGVVETPLALHVLRRVEPPSEGEVQHIMVARGHERWRAVPSVHVQRELVRRRAAGLRAAVVNHPHLFLQIARRASDGPFAQKGGRVSMAMVKQFRKLHDVVAALEPGEVSPIVESPWGLHIFRRLP